MALEAKLRLQHIMLCRQCGNNNGIVPCRNNHRLWCRDCFISQAQATLAKNQALRCEQCGLTGSADPPADTSTSSVEPPGDFGLDTVEFYGNVTCFPSGQRSTCSSCLELVAVVPCVMGHKELCRRCFISWYRACQELVRRRAQEEAAALENSQRIGFNVYKAQPLLPCPSCVFCRKGFDPAVVAHYGDSSIFRKWMFSQINGPEHQVTAVSQSQ